MTEYSEEYLDFCLRIFNMIHEVQKKGRYSHYDLNHVIKSIERNLDKVQYDKDILIEYLDRYYKEVPNWDKGIHMVQLDRIRPIFHKPLKEAGKNPLE